MAALLACLLLAPGWGTRPAAQTASGIVDVAIVLAVDCSWSVDQDEYDQQMQGLSAAFRSSDVIKAFRSGPNGRIAVTLVQWAAPDAQHLSIPWAVLETPADALALADRIDAAPRTIAAGATSITAAISTGILLHRSNPFDADRQVIDVSSDGVNNTGGRPETARDYAVSLGITVNGLTILNEVKYLDHYFRNHIIGGAGSFVETAADYADYHRAIKRKLLREIGLPLS
jgi:hypothetical protein